jgi:photosystem II stability/assembly factor-like uncharacterized protein
MKCSFLRVLFGLLVLSITCSGLFAQVNENWKEIGKFEMKSHEPDKLGNTQGYSGWGITCAFFWDEKHGLIGLGNQNMTPFGLAEIWRTSTGGKTWEQSVLPPLADSEANVEDFSSIFMMDTLFGWATLRYQYYWSKDFSVYHNIILKTSDGGRSWVKDQILNWPEPLVWRVKELPTGELVKGTDIAIVDSNIAYKLALGDVTQELSRTEDGGKTWYTIQANFPAWTIYWDESSRQLFCATYSTSYSSPLRTTGIHASSDEGRTWSPLQTSDFYHHNYHIDGAGGAIYLQTDPGYLFTRTTGFFRSTNGGKNWKHVGGPSRTTWTRFHVPATCNGSLVVGFDSNKVWITTTGGDGTLAYTAPPIINTSQDETVSSCDSIRLKIRLDNIQCRTYVFTRVELKKAAGVFTLDSSNVLPITLPESGQGNLSVGFVPAGQIGFFDDSLRLYGYEETLFGKRYFDTVVYISATSLAVPPQLTGAAATYDFKSLSTCFTRDTLITVTNTGCDTLTLDDVIGSGSAYSFSGIQKPLRLAPGESVSVTVTFHPSALGNHFGNLQLTATQQGITKKTDIPLSGVGTPGEGLLALQSASDVKLPELSICANGDDTLATLRNTGCAPIIVKNVAITGPADYTLASTISNVTLAPDSAIAFRIAFAPQDKGARNASVTVTWTDISGNNPKDITIALSANVIDGNKVLASSLNQINFGETNICEERDSVFTLTNNGCDTLTITGADVEKNFSVDGNYPIVLAPGESIDVPITTIVDTSGKPTVLTGTLAITSTADNQIAPIALTRSLYYPTKLRIEAVDETSGKQGDVVKFRVLLEGQVPATMTSLHFDFLHNADLLSWDGYDGIGLNRTNISGNENERASFSLSPVHDGVLGEFSFKTNLALAEQTTLSFDNITFEAAGVSFAPECIAVISDTGTRFNYIYTCGDNIIRDRLNGTRLIKSITPNPASGEIRLELNAKDATVSIIDMLGAEVLRTSTTDRIDVSKLPSGTYYVRVSTPADVQTKRVVIQR